MNYKATRAAGLSRLKDFIPLMASSYSSKRNYDFGPGNHQYVSGLSAYIRHRLITEKEVLDTVMHHYSYKKASKFIDEIFWRSYWKGWLEQRPNVWQDYQNSLTHAVSGLQSQTNIKTTDQRRIYDQSVTGTTDINCFNHWVHELRETGYIHNHARMWFASIWIFTFKLPWQLGADFFLYHLLDGDPASNTLSWRWVAGLQTENKTYLARPDNIEKYTEGRFSSDQNLASHACPLPFKHYDITPLSTSGLAPQSEPITLLITDDHLSPQAELPSGQAIKKTYILDTADVRSRNGASDKVKMFLKQAIDDCCLRLNQQGIETSIIQPRDTKNQTEISLPEGEPLIVLQAPVGPNRTALESLIHQHKSKGGTVITATGRYDQLCWPYATKGFFAFRKAIPRLLEQIFDQR